MNILSFATTHPEAFLLVILALIGWPGSMFGLLFIMLFNEHLPAKPIPVRTVVMWTSSLVGIWMHYRLWYWLVARLRG